MRNIVLLKKDRRRISLSHALLELVSNMSVRLEVYNYIVDVPYVIITAAGWTDDLKRVAGSGWVWNAQAENSWRSLGQNFVQQ